MKKELIEIYSDTSNFAVMRHPDREFPGSLIQGDSLYILILEIKEAKEELENGNFGDATDIITNVIESLECRLEHYKKTLLENGKELPFVE